MYPPAMSDEEAPPEPPAADPEPAADHEPASDPEPAPRAYLPYAAYSAPFAPPPAPPAPTWTKAYEHPTARRVVSTGLQLAVEANREIRRASIYIGLLALGAFGPAVLLLLLGIARLVSDPSIAATMADDPTAVFMDQPGILGPLALVYFLLIVGVVLLVGISIDAQAMAIGILGGRASDRPLRLWEAITRARQVFWRLFAADLMVGTASTVVTLVITIPFIRPFDSNTGVSFIASMIGALVVTPFAFAAAGVVLGDVGAVEALRRSMALFRARPRISLVVTLFTLVTSAIQTFAVSAGADAAVRVGEFLHLGLDQGALPLILTVVIVLAFIVAFGSLTFTIAAIVAAPQVTGFLGLTYYSGGIDKARSADGTRPRRFRWVSIPMALIMVGILIVAGFGAPALIGFQPRPVGAILSFLRSAAVAEDVYVSPYGTSSVVEDPVGDGGAPNEPSADIIAAEYGSLLEVPSWLLDGAFNCEAPDVTCAAGGSSDVAFADGALLFAQRMAAAPGAGGVNESAWGPVLWIEGGLIGPSPHDDRFRGASLVYLTRGAGTSSSISRYQRSRSGTFTELGTNARAIWMRDVLVTMIPPDELNGYTLQWDMAACETGGTLKADTCDFLRATPGDDMRAFVDGPEFVFLAGFGLPSARSAVPTAHVPVASTRPATPSPRAWLPPAAAGPLITLLQPVFREP